MGRCLARQFYRELQTFEVGPEGIRIYYPTMMKNVEDGYTADGLCRGTEERTSPQKKAEPRELSAVEKLLRQANVNLAASNLEAAVEQFQQVLESDAANGEALYGLGLVATMKNKREIAADYFSKAVASPTAGKSVKVWAHIYLGRIFDGEQKRTEALQQYQSAIALGDNTRNARTQPSEDFGNRSAQKRQDLHPDEVTQAVAPILLTLPGMIENLHKLESILGYSFRRLEILERAVTHSSAANEKKIPAAR